MTVFTVFAPINGASSVRSPKGRLLGLIRADGFDPTQFPQEWGMDAGGVRATFARALREGRVVFTPAAQAEGVTLPAA